MALSESGNLQSNKLQRGPSLRLELELTPPKDSPPNIAARDSAATKAGSAGDHDPRGHVTGQPASPLLVDTTGFLRPRFIVLPTGRLFFTWGIWDTQEHPLESLPTGPFRMLDFVHRTKTLGKALAYARRLNEKHERKAAA